MGGVARKSARAVINWTEKDTISAIFQQHPHHPQEAEKHNAKEENTGNPFPVTASDTQDGRTSLRVR